MVNMVPPKVEIFPLVLFDVDWTASSQVVNYTVFTSFLHNITHPSRPMFDVLVVQKIFNIKV